MKRPRRRADFRPLGQAAGSLPVPARDRARLVLSHAWTRVAGEAIARRVAAVEISRGTLVLRVADGRWAAVLGDLIPRLAARLASGFPDLGVRRFRIQREGEAAPSSPAEALPSGENGPEAVEAGPGTARRDAVTAAPPPRLETLAEAYLARAAAHPRNRRAR